MNQTSLMRRVLTGAAGLMIGAVGALALAAPASADKDDEQVETFDWAYSSVTFNHHCDATWVEVTSGTVYANYTWTITAENGDEFTKDVPAGKSDSVELPTDAGEIVVDFANADGPGGSPGTWPQSDTWSEEKVSESEKPCEKDEEEPAPQPEPEGPTGEVFLEFDCEEAVFTATNTTDVDEVLDVVPSVGDPVELTIPAGGEASATFPASEGLTVDLQFEGESVIEGGPLEITSEQWADAGCEEGGEGGELPVTGSSTMFIAGGAVLLLAVGGGLFLVARRRRVTFTA